MKYINLILTIILQQTEYFCIIFTTVNDIGWCSPKQATLAFLFVTISNLGIYDILVA